MGLVLVWTIPLPARLSAPGSTVVAWQDGRPAHVFLSADDRYRIAVRPDEVDPDLVAALLRFEDKRFYRHGGVDPIAVVRSAWLNLRHGRVVSGASTLTMQVVRLLEPRPRHLGSKLIEMLRAVQLELRMSKDEILGAWMTFAPYGRNVEGVHAAAYAYFGHGADDLSADEIAVLLAVPQRPARRFPTAGNEPRLRRARDEIAAFLAEEEVFTPAADLDIEAFLAQIAAMPVPTGLRPLPRDAPHAAFWARARRPGAIAIPTHLDRGSQRLAERILGAAAPELAGLGIHNGAVVVVEHATGEVRALIGGPDFFDADHGGQIPAFDVARSPGSALKPFIFALAVDDGLALPLHLVPDVPSSWGNYRPGNYDGDFNGLTTLSDALSVSLNVPFVHLLSDVGVDRFVAALRTAGATGLRPDPGWYGLAAAVGGAEVTPLELAGLFAALADDGRARRPQLLADGDPPPAVPLLSPGAAYLTRRILARRDRPDFPERRRFSGAPPHLHWKTGTSYGRRDAWAAGSGPRYTAVVWLGNVDNRPSADLVGADAAGPLLFDLLQALDPTPKAPLRAGPPADLKPIEVCAYSGYLPAPACDGRRTVLARREHVPTARCPYHVAVDVDLDRGLAVNADCRAGRRWATRSFVVWPTAVERWLGERHRLLAGPPTLAPECTPAGPARPPTILSPPPGQVLVLLAGVSPERQMVPLDADTRRSGARLSWFVDGEWLGSVAAQDRLWWQPTTGEHEVVVMDEAGLSARRGVRVVRR
jgi:penicillin-binding protein 1C